MSVTTEQLMRECASHPIVQANYTMDEIKSVWIGITSFLEESLSAGKVCDLDSMDDWHCMVSVVLLVVSFYCD